MNVTICTIGFAGKTAEEFFRLLTDAGVRRVLDVRENRGGQLSGYAKYPDIEFLLRRVAGIDYGHEALLAPTPELRKHYRVTKDWAQYEKAFLELMLKRNLSTLVHIAEFTETTALLCSEPGPEKCHRRLVAESLAREWNGQGNVVNISHLVVHRSSRRSPRKRPAPGL